MFEPHKLFARRIKAIDGLERGSDDVRIILEDDGYIHQYHETDCCESVSVEQVDGDVQKHIGATIYSIEVKVLDYNDLPAGTLNYTPESLTATFYTMKTSKGYLDWRWFGESNGYYSERVDCHLYDKDGNRA